MKIFVSVSLAGALSGSGTFLTQLILFEELSQMVFLSWRIWLP